MLPFRFSSAPENDVLKYLPVLSESKGKGARDLTFQNWSASSAVLMGENFGKLGDFQCKFRTMHMGMVMNSGSRRGSLSGVSTGWYWGLGIGTVGLVVTILRGLARGREARDG